MSTSKQSNVNTTGESQPILSFPTTPTGQSTPEIREISEVSFYFLQHEMIKYICNLYSNSEPSKTNNTIQNKIIADDKKHVSGSTSNSFLNIGNYGLTVLEEAGFNLGLRVLERLILTRNRIWDSRECVKFICKDVWSFLFRKQADRLQTNRKGGYVILDYNLPPLCHLPLVPKDLNSTNVSSTVKPDSSCTTTTLQHYLPSTHLSYICGIIRGALTNLGFPCNVVAECTKPPTCSFQIRLN